MKKITLAVAAAVLALTANNAHAQTQQVQVTITSNAPSGGVSLTPLWGGFHDGSFDSYNGGTAALPGIESIAEDGDAGLLSTQFNAGFSYINPNLSGAAASQLYQTAQTSGRVDFVAGSSNGTPPPIQPGESVSRVLTLDANQNRYFSYASMILASNDYLVFNGNPTLRDVSSLFNGGGPISFNIGVAGDVNDAGTEINDFDFSAGNPLVGLAGGQAQAGDGNDENGVITNVTGDPYTGFLNLPNNDLSNLNFNNTDLYENGIATITISAVAVPEPSSALLLMSGFVGLVAVRRRK